MELASSPCARSPRPGAPEEIARLVATAEAEGPVAAVAVLLQLDAGLRLGEALGLRWGGVAWGVDEDDMSRHLRVSETRSRGGAPEPPKSSRERCLGLVQAARLEFFPTSARAGIVATDPGHHASHPSRYDASSPGCDGRGSAPVSASKSPRSPHAPRTDGGDAIENRSVSGG